MSKVATIEKAILELERQAGEVALPWKVTALFRSDTEVCISAEDGWDVTNADEETGYTSAENAALILTLTRTIEPQLALLRLAVKYGELDAGSGSSFIAAAHDLALSILEETNE